MHTLTGNDAATLTLNDGQHVSPEKATRERDWTREPEPSVNRPPTPPSL
jgi:hypothetical protein